MVCLHAVTKKPTSSLDGHARMLSRPYCRQGYTRQSRVSRNAILMSESACSRIRHRAKQSHIFRAASRDAVSASIAQSRSTRRVLLSSAPGRLASLRYADSRHGPLAVQYGRAAVFKHIRRLVSSFSVFCHSDHAASACTVRSTSSSSRLACL